MNKINSFLQKVFCNNTEKNIGKRTHKLSAVYPKDRAWLEIDLNNLKHNAAVLKDAMPDKCQLMAVVKANAYGHGAVIVSQCLEDMGVKAFAVATIDEGIELRKHGIRGDILIMGYTHISRAKELHKYNLIQTVFNYHYGVQLNESRYKIKAHIKIDTGMHRLGIDVSSIRYIKNIFGMKYLEICGIYTHLCVCDSLLEDDIIFTKKQINAFYELIDNLKESGVSIPKIHIQSSYGLLNYPSLRCDYVRAGISLYGTLSHLNDETRCKLDLHSVLSLKARISNIIEVKEGEAVGYGRAFTALKATKVSVVSVGYADGIPRSISGSNGRVIINGKYAPIIGRICMDQMMVDITDIQDVSVDTVVIIIGKEGSIEVKAEEMAENSRSITNEVLSRLGSRLAIVYKV